MAVNIKGLLTQKPVLIAAGVIAVAVIGGGAVFLYTREAGDGDWNIVETISDFAKGVKNEPKGCCPPHDGQLTKTECDQSGGFSWSEEECPGFAVELTADSTTDLSGGGTGYAKYNFDIYTCSDSVYSEWKGHWDAYWTWTTEDGGQVNDSRTNQEFRVTISPEGVGTYQMFWDEIGARTITFRTDGLNMTFDVEHKNLNPASDTKDIIRGAGRCVFEL